MRGLCMQTNRDKIICRTVLKYSVVQTGALIYVGNGALFLEVSGGLHKITP